MVSRRGFSNPCVKVRGLKQTHESLKQSGLDNAHVGFFGILHKLMRVIIFLFWFPISEEQNWSIMDAFRA